MFFQTLSVSGEASPAGGPGECGSPRLGEAPREEERRLGVLCEKKSGKPGKLFFFNINR